MARLDYVNARLGARRSRLLGAPGLRELLALPTLELRIELLRQRAPRAPLPAELGSDPIGRVEAALRDGLRREAAGLLDDVEGARARALLAAFLALDEALAVKAVLRGVAKGLPPDRTVAAAPVAPGLGDEALRAAASTQGLDGAVEALARSGSELAASARGALTDASRGLLPLELAVDRASLARARRACRRGGEDAALLLRHVEDRADARNAATLLALGGAEPAADFFVPGGRRLGAAVFRHLAGAPMPLLRTAIARVFPGQLASPWSADRTMESALAAPLRREARRNPLSIAVPLSYLADRWAEVRRVALVLRGAALGLEGAEILDLVEA